MSESCALIPKVRKADGTLVESRLFTNLLSYTNNRTKTKEYYAIGKSEEFLDEVADKAKFDSNGEITMSSLLELANLDIEEDRILEGLNKEIASGEYSYEEALSKMQYFNTANDLREDYLATIEESNNGKVILKIVKNTDSNRNDLIEHIKNRSLQDRLKYKLSQLGVEVGFLENTSVEGRYSTVNAEKTANGMYNLINIAHGERGEEALAEETGHFILGAFGNHPLAIRLLNSLTPEVQKELLGEDRYRELIGRNNPDREVAGYLIGEALKTSENPKNFIDSLIHRLINVAKKVFYKVTKNEVALMKTQALEVAEKLASNFMSDNFEGTLENALSTEETLYSARDSVPVKELKRIIEILRTNAIKIKHINAKASKHYYNLLNSIESGKILNVPDNALADTIALDGILETVINIPEELESVKDKLAKLDINYDSIDSKTAKTLRECYVFIQNVASIKKLIDESLVPQLNSEESLYGDSDILNTIREQSRIIGDLLSVITPTVNMKNRLFYSKFLETVLGSKYVKLASKKVFKKQENDTYTTEEKEIAVYDLLDSPEEILWLVRKMSSMSNSSITNQLVNKAVRRLKKAAHDRIVAIKNELDVLRSDLEKIGGNTREFFEKDPNTGKFTGNIIDKYLYGVIEQEKEEHYKQHRKDFLEIIKKENEDRAKNGIPNYTRNEVALKWTTYYEPFHKNFMESHFNLSDDGRTLIPVDKYINTYYRDNIEGTEKEKWLIRYNALKEAIDKECLGKHAAKLRAPQFKGHNLNRFRNRLENNSFIKSSGSLIHDNFTEAFLEDSEDRDFGSQFTYNPQDEDYVDKDLIKKERINRIPLFGINKLKNMEDLSTDLFHSTLAYASMAYRYNVSKQFEDILEIGYEVTKKGIKASEDGREEKRHAHHQLGKFIDKELYGFKTEKITYGKVVLNKVASLFSSLASKVFLGGNVAGGMANFNTGFVEIFKEAVAGEHFTVAQWRQANLEYIKNLPENMLHMGDLRKFDKVSLFIERFDTQNDAEEKGYSYFTDRSNLFRLNPLGHNLFLPYKTGEHYMQNIAFIATAIGTTLIDPITNEKTNLWEALVPEEIKDSSGKVIGKRLVLQKDYVIDKSYTEDYKMIASISSKLNESISLFGIMPTFTKEEIDFMQSNNIDYTAPSEKILANIREIRSKILWDSNKESDYMDKCREVNNMLHGIYNSQDKTEFHQNLLLNMLTSMRNYAFGMIMRRFGHSRHSVTLGHDIEGSLITSAKVVASLFTSERDFKMALLALCPLTALSDKTKAKMLAAGFSANQYANIRRSAIDYLFIGGLMLLKMALAAGEGEGDEEDNISMGIAYYFVSRLLREQRAFNDAAGFIAEFPSLTSTEPAGFSVLSTLGELATLYWWKITGDERGVYQRSGETYDKDDVKFDVKVQRLLPYWKSTLVLENPYYSAKSYEFGRRNR